MMEHRSSVPQLLETCKSGTGWELGKIKRPRDINEAWLWSLTYPSRYKLMQYQYLAHDPKKIIALSMRIDLLCVPIRTLAPDSE